jgi:hypothetical protein
MSTYEYNMLLEKKKDLQYLSDLIEIYPYSTTIRSQEYRRPCPAMARRIYIFNAVPIGKLLC